MGRDGLQIREQEWVQNERDFYGELAKWGERIALAIFISLVVQRLVSGATLGQVILGSFVSAIVYYYSFRLLKISKPF
jgi:hypothetical protein